MNLGDYQAVEQQLSKEYFMLKKGSALRIIGGAIILSVFVLGLIGLGGPWFFRKAVEHGAGEILSNLVTHEARASELVAQLRLQAGVGGPTIPLAPSKKEGRGEWLELLQVPVNSTVKFEGLTMENNHIQPWLIYVNHGPSEGRQIMVLAPETMSAFTDEDKVWPSKSKKRHTHSAAVEWTLDEYGILKVRSAWYETQRYLKILQLQVVRGNVKAVHNDLSPYFSS